MSNRRNLCVVACIAVGFCWLPQTSTAAQRNWQTGTVMDYEKQVVPQGSRITTNTDGQARNQDGKVRYSENSTTTVNNDEDTYQVYTIKAPATTYIVSEKLWFPWSKPTPVVVGGEVKYAVDGNKMYLMGTDGKEHKGTIVKASVSTQ